MCHDFVHSIDCLYFFTVLDIGVSFFALLEPLLKAVPNEKNTAGGKNEKTRKQKLSGEQSTYDYFSPQSKA